MGEGDESGCIGLATTELPFERAEKRWNRERDTASEACARVYTPVVAGTDEPNRVHEDSRGEISR